MIGLKNKTLFVPIALFTSIGFAQEPLIVHNDQHAAMGVLTDRKKGFQGMWEEEELQVQANLANPIRKMSPEVNVNDIEPTSHEQD